MAEEDSDLSFRDAVKRKTEEVYQRTELTRRMTNFVTHASQLQTDVEMVADQVNHISDADDRELVERYRDMTEADALAAADIDWLEIMEKDLPPETVIAIWDKVESIRKSRNSENPSTESSDQ